MNHSINTFFIKRNLLLLITFLTFTQSHSQEAYPIVPNHYNLSLSFNFEEETLQGTCELKVTNQSNQTTEEVSFLLYRLMKVYEIHNKEGAALPYTQQVTEFDDFGQLQVNQIKVPLHIQPGESTTFKITYGGYLLGYEETGMHYIKDRISPEFTLIRFDTYAYPYPCLPNSEVLISSTSRRFTYTLHIETPNNLIAANGGELIERQDKGEVSIYQYSSKLPGWRIDIGIAPYEEIELSGLKLFYFSNTDAANQLSQRGEECIKMYSKWWGDLKSDFGITIIETAEGSGGQTDKTTILLPSESFNNSKSYNYLYHELSHLWNVPIQEKEGLAPRWEEGLATFCQFLAAEKMGLEEAGYTQKQMNRYINRFHKILSNQEELNTTPLVEYGNKDLTQYSYIQPAIMFSVLYYWQGEELFNQVIGGFYQKYAESSASTSDFINYFLEIAQKKALKHFFDEWVYTTNYIKDITSDNTIKEIVNKWTYAP